MQCGGQFTPSNLSQTSPNYKQLQVWHCWRRVCFRLFTLTVEVTMTAERWCSPAYCNTEDAHSCTCLSCVRSSGMSRGCWRCRPFRALTHVNKQLYWGHRALIKRSYLQSLARWLWRGAALSGSGPKVTVLCLEKFFVSNIWWQD